jgi:hypothetical protein
MRINHNHLDRFIETEPNFIKLKKKKAIRESEPSGKKPVKESPRYRNTKHSDTSNTD